MGCLFGYFGKPDPAILPGMARLLAGRCHNGFEQAKMSFAPDSCLEIGRGLPPWGAGAQIFSRSGHIFGHSGVLFNSGEVLPGLGYDGRPDSSFAGSEAESNGEGANGSLDIQGALERLEGAFVAASAHKGEFFLVRDHAGIKAVYWTRHRDRLVFASEIKALFADPLVERKMRRSALPEYLTFSFVPGPKTMFENIFELQPGSILKLTHGDLSIKRHFLFERLEPTSDGMDIEHYGGILRDELENSVRLATQFCSEPPAVFLSGGIDSSSVLAMTARRFSGARIKTYSIHFGPDYANENDYVSMMVEKYNTDHHWVEIKPQNFMERMKSIFWRLDDPIGDPITVPNFIMAEQAAKENSIVLNGEGGDPCFGGPKNLPMILGQIYGPIEEGPAWVEKEYLRSFRKCYEDLEQIIDPEIVKESGGHDALASIISPFLTTDAPQSFLNKLMAMNIRMKGANLILVKVDKMTSANGVLALPPLFSKGIIEFAMSCPPGYKLRGAVEKAVLKAAVKDIVPAPIIDRPKCGMMVPVRFWFRDEMSRYAKRVLSKKNLRKLGYFNPDYVGKLLKYEVEDSHGLRYGLKLWMLITFMIWHELMMENWNEGGSRESTILDKLFRKSRFGSGR
jgi:asparagine synthase (glutamine-hydrolysing)